jgi:uncharacterized protein (DUF433 family)
MKDYVVKLENGAYRIAETRVSLDSIVYDFKQGRTPEQILVSFPTLELEQIYGAITFYLQNRREIDEYLKTGEIAFEKMSREWRKTNAVRLKKLKNARQELKV